MKRCLLSSLALILTACAAPAPEVDPDYRAEIEAWRAKRLESLTAEDGWLTVAGLHWLTTGANRFGSDPTNEVVLDVPAVPPLAGTLDVGDAGTVVARAAADAGVTVNGSPLVESALATDATGKPDVVGVGRLSFYVIERSGRLGVRVKDPDSAARRGFKGIESYPIDPRYRVTATLEPYEALREVTIQVITGDQTTMLAPGVLRFELLGEELTLEPYLESPQDERYFLIFRDRTSGDTTYGGGRFLSAALAGPDGATTVDFNFAYSPPCAFTAYATCPLPPPQNALPVAVEAGEKFAGHGH